ncbi:membrane protein containing TM2 domain protein, partial [Candidatus Magnetobacterium bavaricum]
MELRDKEQQPSGPDLSGSDLSVPDLSGPDSSGVGSTDGYKNRTVAGIYGVTLGAIGVHRFYLGYTSIGIAQILVTLLTCGVGALWGIIEGWLILWGGGLFDKDAHGNPLVKYAEPLPEEAEGIDGQSGDSHKNLATAAMYGVFLGA